VDGEERAPRWWRCIAQALSFGSRGSRQPIFDGGKVRLRAQSAGCRCTLRLRRGNGNMRGAGGKVSAPLRGSRRRSPTTALTWRMAPEHRRPAKPRPDETPRAVSKARGQPVQHNPCRTTLTRPPPSIRAESGRLVPRLSRPSSLRRPRPHLKVEHVRSSTPRLCSLEGRRGASDRSRHILSLERIICSACHRRHEQRAFVRLNGRWRGGYEASEGARFEVRFTKSRGFWGSDAEPFEARFADGKWSTSEIVASDSYEALAAMRAERLTIRQIAERTGLSKSAVDRRLKGDER